MHPRAHRQRTSEVSSTHTVPHLIQDTYNPLAIVPALPSSRLPRHFPTPPLCSDLSTLPWPCVRRIVCSDYCYGQRFVFTLGHGSCVVATQLSSLANFDCPLYGMQGGAMYLTSSTASISGASFTSCSAVSVDCFQLFTTPTKPGLVDQCHPRHFPVAVSQSHGTYDTLASNRTRTWALAPHPHSNPAQ